MNTETRIDVALLERGLCRSRTRAKTLLKEERVLLNGIVCTKPSMMIRDTDDLKLVEGDDAFVGRGSLKLEEALRRFPVSPSGRTCLDVGASTGGFTDCMLRSGAMIVYAVDVGHDQLDVTLRKNPQVVNLEGTDIRLLDRSRLARKPDFCSIDVSFISLQLILPAVYALLSDGADCIALIKPQFEAGKSNIGKKGVVKSAKVHVQVLEQVIGFARSIGFSVQGLCPSPIRGGTGNAEYLLYMKKSGAPDAVLPDLKTIVAEAGVNG
ncbi:MAG: TlyA family RNA methyltransferase [Oscillospiraceae bacterium]|nr:TlyA family RNA methyltransferase [Oscillospiraceae bacterium]